MNTNDLNARSSLTRRQRRSQAPRVECLESREVLSYPAAGVNYLIYEAVVKHKNTAVQVVTGVDKSLTADLTAGPLATLIAGGPSAITPTSAQTFVTRVDSLVTSYQSSAAAQLSPRFPWVYSQILTYSNNIETGVASQLTQYEHGVINNVTFWEASTYIINHGGPG